MTEELASRLSLEEHLGESENNNIAVNFHLKKTILKNNLKKNIHFYCKKNKMSWLLLAHTAWGLLINRFSTADHIVFGSCYGSVKGKNIFQNKSITFLKSIITSQISFLKLGKNIKTQLNQKKSDKKLFAQVRYLLLINEKSKKNSQAIDNNHFLLTLVIDKLKPNQFYIYYNPIAFSLQSINIIAEHLELILQEVIADPNKKACEINLLTKHEKNLLLNEWCCPKDKTSLELSSIFASFQSQAEKNPDQPAIEYEEQILSYKEIAQLVNNLACSLINKNVHVGDRICVLMDRTPTLLIAMLAIFKVGAIFIPINLKYPKERIDYVLDDSQATFIIANQKDMVPESYQNKLLLVSRNHFEINLPAANQVVSSIVDLEEVAYIIYTSGTTGNPKGVMIKHRGLINLTKWYITSFQITKEDRASQFASQGFDPFFCETVPFLMTGACVCIVDDNIKLTPSEFFLWLAKYKITICDLPTSYALMLFSLSWPELPSLRMIKIGGESITHYPTQKFSFDIWNGYGPTETTVETTYAKIYSANFPNEIIKHRTPPIGKPVTNNEAYIVDKHFQLLPIGIAGELLIGGEGLAKGYWNKDNLTNEKFINHSFDNKNIKKLYRTGDLARWLPDGNIEFIGRIDYQIKIRGFRIEPGEIETAISAHPDVNEVVVLANKDIKGEKSLIAYITPNLDKGRYLYQERCLLSFSNDKFMETITEDISKYGIALSGITEQLTKDQLVRLHLKLPGLSDSKTLNGHLVWQHDNRCGILFDLNDDERITVNKSIDYYLSTHNIMEMVLSASAKRNLRKALRKKLPEYMIPAAFVTLMEFPLTFSGKIDAKALPPPQEFEKFFQKKFVAPQSETEKKLAAIWSRLLKQATISMSDNYFDLGGTSLTAAELSSIILDEFKISIPTQILFDLPYIPVLAEYIDTKGKQYTTHTSIQDDIKRDAKLHDNIVANKKISPNLSEPKNILLTGAGGFLGIYLLKELLAQTNAKIHCIIRKGEFETAAKRLLVTIEKFKLEKDVSLANRRIIAIPGDISFDNFGLPTEHYQNLAEHVDLIYHCGAQVNIMTAYHKLRGSNVQGTIEAIKFAVKKINKPIHYISTLSSAYLKNEQGQLIEEFPTSQYEDLFGGYAISKWISERLLAQIADRGLPASIYRSGYIAGDAITGIANLNDALFMLMKGCIQMGYAPDLNEQITLLPVDFVSEAIVQISLKHPDKKSVYHIDHPKGISWIDLIAWINDYGYKVNLITTKEWQQKLTHISHDNALFPFLPYYLALEGNQLYPAVDVSKTAAILKDLKIDYPPIDHQLLSLYFKYFRAMNFIPEPEKKIIS